MTRRSFGQSIAGGVMGVLASAWCPGVLRVAGSPRVADKESLESREPDVLRPGDHVTVDDGIHATVKYSYPKRGLVTVLLGSPWAAYLTLSSSRVAPLKRRTER